MPQRRDIERLKRRFNQQHLGAVTTVANLIVGSLGRVVAELTRQLRYITIEQPLTTLTFALQVGFLIARFGQRHAQH